MLAEEASASSVTSAVYCIQLYKVLEALGLVEEYHRPWYRMFSLLTWNWMSFKEFPCIRSLLLA